jgi:hypothetical protein
MPKKSNKKSDGGAEQEPKPYRYRDYVDRKVDLAAVEASAVWKKERVGACYYTTFSTLQGKGAFDGCSTMSANVCVAFELNGDSISKFNLSVFTVDWDGAGRSFEVFMLAPEDAEHFSELLEAILVD